jgi:hypothetical protein
LRKVGNGESSVLSPLLENSKSMATFEPEQFFRTLYDDEAPGFLAVFTHTPNRTRWVPADSPAEAARIVVQSGRERDTYFGIGDYTAKPSVRVTVARLQG